MKTLIYFALAFIICYLLPTVAAACVGAIAVITLLAIVGLLDLKITVYINEK